MKNKFILFAHYFDPDQEYSLIFNIEYLCTLLTLCTLYSIMEAKEMRDMIMTNATEVRKNWSQVVDGVIREKPAFIKRTRDCMVLAKESLLADMLSVYDFSARKYIEEDGSITLSLNELDLVENAETEAAAKKALAKSILEYATDYYEEFAYWSNSANRKGHVPYVFRALLLDDINKIGECIKCQVGEN